MSHFLDSVGACNLSIDSSQNRVPITSMTDLNVLRADVSIFGSCVFSVDKLPVFNLVHVVMLTQVSFT